MSQFTEFFRYNQKSQDKLKVITDPLKTHFGIDWFWHVTMHENGWMTNICTFYDEWADLWTDGGYEHVDHIAAPSNLHSGYFYLGFEDDYKKSLRVIQEKRPLNHPFINIRKEGTKKVHIYGFGSSDNLATLPSFYVNNIALLNSFIDYYLDSMGHNEHEMIDISELIGHEKFYRKSYGEGIISNPKKNCPFLKQIGAHPDLFKGAEGLTHREKEVLNHCLERKTAAESGEKLGLSPRTIQSYIENIKNRLGVLTREELLRSGKVLKMAGFLE